jgi:hypothetical protein
MLILNKTYAGDLERSLNLYESIKKHNKDNLEFVLCVPEEDGLLFMINFPKVKIYTEELVIKNAKLDLEKYSKMQCNVAEDKLVGWSQQQLIKLYFFKTCKCDYITVDSDAYFIKDFYESDFKGKTVMVPDCIYYDNVGFLKRKETTLLKAFKGIRHFIVNSKVSDTTKPEYFINGYGIWSCKVLKEMEKFMKSKGWNFQDMLEFAPYEMQWYGQFVESRKPIKFIQSYDICHCIGSEKAYKFLRKKAKDLKTDKKYKAVKLVILQSCLNKKELQFRMTLFGYLRNRFKKLVKGNK